MEYHWSPCFQFVPTFWFSNKVFVPKSRHKLKARTSMVLHEILTKKKCNWNVSCGPMFMHKMACFGFTWHRSKKICIKSSNGEPKNRHKLNARSSMVLHEKLTKKKCNWNVSCGRMFMHKWPVMDLFGKGSKKYASKALMVNQKIGTSECKVFNGTPWDTHQKEM